MSDFITRVAPLALFTAFPVAVYGAQCLLHHAATYVTACRIRKDMAFIKESMDMIDEYDIIAEDDLDLLSDVLYTIGIRVETLMTSRMSLTQSRGKALYEHLRALYRQSQLLDGRLAEIQLDVPKARNIRPRS